MAYTYKLPESITTENNQQTGERSTETNSVIIIGANGSGKSRLGAWIEKTDPEHIHRIGAQRNNTVKENIPRLGNDQAVNQFLYSRPDVERFPQYKKSKPEFYQNGRWTSYERNDIDYVLSAVFAKREMQVVELDERAKQASTQTYKREPNIVDNIQEIWDKVYPHRKIKFKDAKIMASFSEKEYNGIEMSDGERVALYLMAQALLVPPSIHTFIIDEPEIHLHRSIMNRLWSAIEEKRDDCLFIYITQDTQFAAAHHSSDKIWVKSFDGSKWDWEPISDSELPEELLINILGNRKPVLLVEGNSNSFDTKLYEILYPNYYIIPCGSCTEVIARTKALKSTSQLNEITAIGIIDRDYRSDIEIQKLSQNGVYVLKVAEVENLFITPEIFSVISQNAGYTNDSSKDNAIDFIINTKFSNMKSQQIRAAAIAECKYQLSVLDISQTTSNTELLEKVAEINYEKIQTDIEKKYNDALSDNDYKAILQLFNSKELSKSVGTFFGGQNDDYCELVLRLARGAKQNEIREALKSYYPSEISFN
jgi:ABC-type dipeptide/oligopeptide/nickel transport system ATPase subunit